MATVHKRFGRYELVTAIGRGGMAELYLGRLVGIGGFTKPVAIKRILPHLTHDERFVEMFLNEGRIAARLSHPNLCQVFELGEVDGELFLAMEYLEGVSWGELVATLPHDPSALVQLTAQVIGQACDGLAYAHERCDSDGNPTPIVHRDVSPGNLFVTVDGVCKLLDFGVSKIVTDTHDTRSGLVKGKLPYMPPEQLRGEHVDARADVFATATVVWEALAGRRLFARDNDYLMFKAILEEPTARLADVDPSYARFDGALDAVIGRALERDRERRCSTIRAFADELRAVALRFGEPIAAGDVGALVRSLFRERLAERARKVAAVTGLYERRDTEVDRGSAVTASVSLRDGSAALPTRRRRRGLWMALGALAVGASATGLVVAMRGEPSGPAAEPVEPRPVASATPQLVDASVAPEPPPPVRDPRPSKPAPRSRQETPPRATAAKKPGFYSVDSEPYATIFIDDKRRDQTPLFRIALSPGWHKVRAVLADGRERTFTVWIESDKHISSKTLSW